MSVNRSNKSDQPFDQAGPQAASVTVDIGAGRRPRDPPSAPMRDRMTTTPTPATAPRRTVRRAAAAVVWSFFIPVIGVILGIRSLRAAVPGPDGAAARAVAWTAIINGAISCVTWVLLAVGIWAGIQTGWFAELADRWSSLYS